MMRKYLWAVLFLLPLAAGSNAYAYVTIGIAWPNGVANYYINPLNDSGLSADSVIASINGADSAWGTVGAGFNFCYQGTTSRRMVQRNGFNDVFFRNQDQGGIIAVTYYWNVGRNYDEFDIVHYEGRFTFYGIGDACSGNGFYLSYITMHELGHGLGMAHSQYNYAVMYASARACDPRSVLEDDDINGVTAIYDAGDPPGCF